MRREDWAARLTDTTAGEVRHYRKVRGMTAQQTVDACEALGLPMARTTLTNLENGRRGNVTIAELLALAEVLDAPPILLLFPLGRSEEIEVLPGRTVPTGEAVKWFTRESPQESEGLTAAASKCVRRYVDGETLPDGAVYLTTITEPYTSSVEANGGQWMTETGNRFVWHYFLVETDE